MYSQNIFQIEFSICNNTSVKFVLKFNDNFQFRSFDLIFSLQLNNSNIVGGATKVKNYTLSEMFKA